MLIRKRRHSVPGLNTTSTADISFMLLIFFLVTTSMDVDKGLRRQLPPEQPEQVQQESLVDRQKLMELRITPDNELLLDGQPLPVGRLRDKAEAFIASVGKDHLISVSADPESTYEVYFSLQNQLMAAYRSVRNGMARRLYGHGLDECTEAERTVVMEQCPQRIAEAYQQTGKGATP